jgi:cytochrome c oxidase subunit I+III
MVIAWMWGSDPEPLPPVDVGSGLVLPAQATGPGSHSWWAMVVLLFVAGSLFLSYVFSYLYLWTVYPQSWPQAGAPGGTTAALVPVALLIVGSASAYAASRTLVHGRTLLFAVLVVAGLGAITLATGFDALHHWRSGLRPEASGYGAMVFLFLFLQAQITLPVLVMGGFALARLASGKLDHRRRATFDNFALLFHYSVAQGLVGLALVHGFPGVAQP